MKLYEVPRNTRIKVADGDSFLFFNFHKLDGMYSYCKDDAGSTVHLAAWTEVEIADEPQAD